MAHLQGKGCAQDILDSHKHSKDLPFSNGYHVHQRGLNPIARLLLLGMYDDDNALSIFRGMPYLMEVIFDMAGRGTDFMQFIENDYGYKVVQFHESPLQHLYKNGVKVIKFPEPRDININMMPFIMNSKFSKTKLPRYLRTYAKLLIPDILR